MCTVILSSCTRENECLHETEFIQDTETNMEVYKCGLKFGLYKKKTGEDGIEIYDKQDNFHINDNSSVIFTFLGCNVYAEKGFKTKGTVYLMALKDGILMTIESEKDKDNIIGIPYVSEKRIVRDLQIFVDGYEKKDSICICLYVPQEETVDNPIDFKDYICLLSKQFPYTNDNPVGEEEKVSIYESEERLIYDAVNDKGGYGYFAVISPDKKLHEEKERNIISASDAEMFLCCFTKGRYRIFATLDNKLLLNLFDGKTYMDVEFTEIEEEVAVCSINTSNIPNDGKKHIISFFATNLDTLEIMNVGMQEIYTEEHSG